MENDGAFFCENLEFDDKPMFKDDKDKPLEAETPTQLTACTEAVDPPQQAAPKKYIRKAYKRV